MKILVTTLRREAERLAGGAKILDFLCMPTAGNEYYAMVRFDDCHPESTVPKDERNGVFIFALSALSTLDLREYVEGDVGVTVDSFMLPASKNFKFLEAYEALLNRQSISHQFCDRCHVLRDEKVKSPVFGFEITVCPICLD